MKVAIAGATGETGSSIVDGLLKSDLSFEITALVRPSSLNKPAIKDLKTLGVKIISADLQGSQDDLVKCLAGIDVVISAIHFQSICDEIPLSNAAKAAGVKRYVPCFFATVAPRGIMRLRDNVNFVNPKLSEQSFADLYKQKEEILDHIQRINLPYTVIDVGWWYQLTLPRVPSGLFDYALLFPINSVFAGGDTPSALTDVRDIGSYVAKIIADPSTLNKKVFAHTECKTQNEVFDLVEKLTGETIQRTELSAADIESKLVELEGEIANRTNIEVEGVGTVAQRATYEYWHSWGLRGDNNPKYAKYLGYLLVDDLYPGLKGRALESYVKEIIDQKAKRAYGK